MPSVIENVKNGIKSAFSPKVLPSLTEGTMKLADPDNVSSMIGYGDLDEQEQAKLRGYLAGTEAGISFKDMADALMDLGEEWYMESRQGRWKHHEDFFSGLAAFAGEYNLYWNQEANSGNGMMQGFPNAEGNTDFDEKFAQKYENVFRVMIERAQARITAAYPDAWAAPLNDTDKDKLAAQVLRSINGHCSRETNREQLMEDICLYMLITTTTFIEVGWNPKAYADLGIPQPDGSVEYHREQIGDVVNRLVMAIDAYPDPNAALNGGDIHGGAYFIKRHLMNVQDVSEKWGRPVTPTSPGSTFGFLQARMELIAGDHSRILSKIKNSTEITEVWNKPSKQYPRGRFWVYSADRTLLWAGEWPYEKNDEYPFVEFGFKKNAGSVWALNMGRDLLPTQRTLNRLATYLAARLEWDRPTILAPSNCDIAPDDFLNPTLYKVIAFEGPSTGGSMPIYQQPPQPGEFYFKYEQSLLAKMEMLAGVRDLNGDNAQPINSGIEYGLRLKTDKERLAPAIKMMGRGRAKLYEWDGALYRQFGASFPRLLGIDDMAIPGKDLEGAAPTAATKLVDLQALKDGNTRVFLEAGSGEARLPEAQEAQLQEVTKLLTQAMAQPGGAAIVEWYLGQSQAIRSDQETDRLVVGVKQLVAEQAEREAQTAMNVQQAKGGQSQQAQQAKQQADLQAMQLKHEQDQAKAAIDVHSQALVEQFRGQTDMAVNSQKFQQAMMLLHTKNAVPSVTLTGTLDPAGESSAQEKAGLSAGDMDTLKKMLIKPAPTKGSSNGSSATK